MHAEIIAIGTELTSGAKLDTNSQWLSQQLDMRGIPVWYHSTVGDVPEALSRVFARAAERNDLVFITGGLGPTLDDITRDELARMAGVELVLHQESFDQIVDFFERRGRTMPERNKIQAMIPTGAQPIVNSRGTAPGIWMTIPHAKLSREPGDTNCQIFALPGVPAEMKKMFFDSVAPQLPDSGRLIQQARLNCYGTGESHMEELLGDLTARGNDPEVGITVHEATITLRIAAHGETAEECAQKIAAAKMTARERLGDFVFGEENEDVEHAAVKLLREKRRNVATIEWGTAGRIAQRIMDVNHSDDVFAGGSIIPSLDGLARFPELSSDALSEVHPESKEMARVMANACRATYESDYAIAVTECPPFDPDETSGNLPQAFIALADHESCEVHPVHPSGNPLLFRVRTAKSALNLLRLRLLRGK